MDNKQETMGPIKGAQHSIPIEILDDLSSRFIINVPEEERTNLVRICFQIELAHWFYLDFYCTDETTKVYPCGMKEFSAHIFQHIPFLQKHRPNLENILDHWREYKQSVPTYGAILLNEELTHVMLVQSYWAKASWGFPKGKVNEDEEPWHCACREVLEETGFDITSHINKNDFIESTIHDQIVRLYIIGYIPQSTKFAPRTRNEIKACEWFPIADLPANRKDMTPKLKMGVSPNAFFMVLPFVKRMKRWVAEKTQKNNSNSKRLRHKSMGDLEASTGKTRNNTKMQAFQKDIAELHQTAATAVLQQTSQTIQGTGNVFQQTSIFHHSGNAFQPTGNNFQQTTKSFQQSGNSFQQSGNSFQQPGNSFQQPGNSFQQQSNSFQQPGNSFQQTGNVFQPTGSNVLQPSSINNKPKNNSNQKNANSGKKEKKGNFKRQLFTNSNYPNQPTDKASYTAPAVVENNSCASNTNYFAKSWMNFKFDRKAIWDSMA